ncbi:MAG: DUF3048 domain-containing protein [Actinomycetota bacterium]|nr:DUF3048 domain-containing protein [Actinomycetota bacterium]
MQSRRGPTATRVCEIGGQTEGKPTCAARSEVPSNTDPLRPAVAVKVENDPAARPQSGLEEADVVFEEIVEGGITRFMAIYHCGDAKEVGPVRSARFDDPKIALPFTRILAFSGANSIVTRELKRNDMATLVEGMKGDAFYRIPEGSISVHSVFVDTAKLREAAPPSRPPRPDVFTTGRLNDNATRARRVSINFSSDSAIEYRWEKNEWRRYEGGEKFMAASGGQIGVPNLLIQEVQVDNSPTIVDIEGNPSPDIKLRGQGRAVLFRDGHAVKGKWTIKKEGDPAKFVTEGGDEFTFADGPVWIELVPSRRGQVKGRFSFK